MKRREFLAAVPIASILSVKSDMKEPKAVLVCSNVNRGCTFETPCDFHLKHGAQFYPELGQWR